MGNSASVQNNEVVAQEIYYNDEDVACLSSLSRSLIKDIGEHFNCLPKVFIFETIHGHIANFIMPSSKILGYDKSPKALDMDDVEFLSGLSNLRHISLTNTEIAFHFRN
jgi:hypothetical protein